MYSNVFCRTFEIGIEDGNHMQNDGLGIELYKIELLIYQELVSVLTNLLSPSERHRANRYHFVKDKNRFIICRALLKFLLAEHTGLELAKIALDIDTNKKPYLPSHPSVFFNVTHAGDYAMIAIARSPVGVDIEYINRNFDYKEILPTIFAEIEIDTVNNDNDKHGTFYRFWTRKEAIVKAIGKGIDDDLPKIIITDGLHYVPLFLVGNFKTINVCSFNLNSDYVGAIAFTENVIDVDKIAFYPIPTSDELKSLLLKR